MRGLQRSSSAIKNCLISGPLGPYQKGVERGGGEEREGTVNFFMCVAENWQDEVKEYLDIF